MRCFMTQETTDVKLNIPITIQEGRYAGLEFILEEFLSVIKDGEEHLDAVVSSNVLDVNYPEVQEAIQKRITSFIEAAIEEVEGLKGLRSTEND